MKKFLMIFALAASVMMVSCDKKAGGGAAEGSAAVEEQAAGGPVEMKLSSVSSSGTYYHQMSPSLKDFALVATGEEGDSVAVEATVMMEASEAKEVKALKSAGVKFSYRMPGDGSSTDVKPVLQLDPSQYDAAVALAKAGVKDDYKPFKFVGKVAKTDLENLKKAECVFLNTSGVDFEE